ncbi:hypothetical protein Btru_061637 [Bulinus truncatus]|nr:hypothetical protein Btru_061637 [Bulinus truncatus]
MGSEGGRDGQINEVESLYLELTKNGVITLQQSLNSSSEEIFLYILRRVLSFSTEILPVLVHVQPDENIPPMTPMILVFVSLFSNYTTVLHCDVILMFTEPKFKQHFRERSPT